MADSQTRKLSTGAIVAIIVVVALVISFFIPVQQWDSKITKGRAVSEATITQVSGDTITATLEGTATSLTMKGNIPSHAKEGQSIRTGYSKSGLYEDTSQKVEVAYFIDGNLLNDIIRMVFGSARRASDDLTIIDVKSDGSLLQYYVAA